jgi:hypothetical protein
MIRLVISLTPHNAARDPSELSVNHSYPLALDSPTQESFIGNIACGAARCEIMRRQEGKPVCGVVNP